MWVCNNVLQELYSFLLHTMLSCSVFICRCRGLSSGTCRKPFRFARMLPVETKWQTLSGPYDVRDMCVRIHGGVGLHVFVSSP